MEFEEKDMTKWICPVLFVLLTVSCTAVDHNTVKLTPEEEKIQLKKAEHLKSQIAAKDIKIIEEEKSTSEIRQNLADVHENCEELSEQIDEKLAEAEKIMDEIRELNKKLGPPSAEDEAAAEKLLLEAKYFQKQNPTEAKTVIASKYKVVFERYSRTKAAKEAREIYEKLPK